MNRIAPNQTLPSAYRLIDVREYPEYLAATIEHSELVPLASLEGEAVAWPRGQPLLLVCRSGKRAFQAAEKLERMGFSQLNVLDGGIEAWRKAGLPVVQSTRGPWSLERQVRAISGSLVVLSTLCGLTISPWLFGLTLFVGSGLVFAGVTDICVMATLLGKLPWNKPQA